MMLDRRHFAKMLGAAAFLAPFMRIPSAYAAAPNGRRLLVVYSLATNLSLWRPKSAPGQPVQLSPALSPLQSILGDIVLVDGLTPADPSQTHATEQTFTARNNYSSNTMSVDQYIASKAGLPAPLLLGVKSASASQFFNTSLASGNGGAMPPNDDPVNAYNLLFGAAPAAAAAAGPAVPKTKILDLITKQLQSMQQGLGSEQRNKLEQHINAVASLDKSMSGAPMAGCTKPPAPNLGGMDPQAQASTIPVGEAQQDLIVGALACDLTRVVGMQWGTSTEEYLSGTLGYDEHSAIHSEGQEAKVNASENYLCTWFANLINKLRATNDPKQAGKTLLDTTLVVWSRDFAHQAPGVHSNYSMPYVLAGATDYLKTSPKGTYFNYGGDDLNSQTRGKPHEKLLLNCCEAMGVTDYSGFGQLTGADQAPLAEIKV